MKLLDLCSGTESISKVFRDAGHETFTIDIDPQFNADLTADIRTVEPNDIIEAFGFPDVIWASPPCTTFSIASCSTHWTSNDERNMTDPYACEEFPRSPKSDACHVGVEILEHILYLIEELNPDFWFMENPRGMMRKHPLTWDFDRTTVTYCQYGDSRMKPTDIWGVWPPLHQWRPMCKNGDPCHEAAPRGSKTGTQGRANAVERSRVPEELCKSILASCEGYYEIGNTLSNQSHL
jgi:site-specific DNA-cytosine methylase